MTPTKQNGPDGSANSRGAMDTQKGTEDTAQGSRRKSPRHVAGQLALDFENRKVPTAWASQYAPAGRRTWWWLAFRCPHGCAGHFARSPRHIEDGLRRAGCGRLVWIVTARTYRGKVAA